LDEADVEKLEKEIEEVLRNRAAAVGQENMNKNSGTININKGKRGKSAIPNKRRHPNNHKFA
jgi:hypothetical protein